MRKKQIGQKVAVALFAAMLALSGCSKPVDSPKQDPGAQSSPGAKQRGSRQAALPTFLFSGGARTAGMKPLKRYWIFTLRIQALPLMWNLRDGMDTGRSCRC